MSIYRIKSKSRVNLAYDKFFRMIRQSYINCKIELIENFPCNNELKNRKTKYLTNKQKQENKKINLFKRIL